MSHYHIFEIPKQPNPDSPLMELFLKADTWLALLTLTFFEIVLGIDNIIFISIVSNRLPVEMRKKARTTGLALAMIVRILLLLGITWVMKFTEPLFFSSDLMPDAVFSWLNLPDHPFSGRDLILMFGGMFLIAKSTREIGHEMEGEEDIDSNPRGKYNITGVIVQIILLDIVFSFDSILTAVGLTKYVIIMIIAVVISIFIMMIFSGRISDFINRHPSMEVLALGFLILIGFMLFLEGLEYEIPKGYIYFAVAFSLLIEFVNIRVRGSKRKKREAEADEQKKKPLKAKDVILNEN